MSETIDAEFTVADRAVRMITALSAEVVVLRERLDLFEHVAARRGSIEVGEIDRCVPDATLAAQLKAQRLGLISRVFAALRI